MEFKEPQHFQFHAVYVTRFKLRRMPKKRKGRKFERALRHWSAKPVSILPNITKCSCLLCRKIRFWCSFSPTTGEKESYIKNLGNTNTQKYCSSANVWTSKPQLTVCLVKLNVNRLQYKVCISEYTDDILSGTFPCGPVSSLMAYALVQ
jgi:hypothetical protein